MICKDTLTMIAGGLLAGYGAAGALGEKNGIKKLEVIGPLIAGAAILSFGYMNYTKGKGGGGLGMKPPKQMIDMPMEGMKQSAVPTPLSPNKPLKVMANYTFPTLNASGNASPSYDYNHIYPGFI
jgi:hypothetical protein